MPRRGPSPRRAPAKSGAWTKPGCSLQDLPPRGRPARPRRLNALDPEPRCSLQADRRAAADRVGAAADGCGQPHRDGSGGNSSDSRDELRATSAGYRRSLERIQDQPGTSCGGTRCVAWPDTRAGYKRLGRDGVWKVERLAGNTRSSVAGKSLPPRYVWGPTLRKADPAACRRRYRVWCRVLTASSPMGPQQHWRRWRRPKPAKMAPFLAGPNIASRSLHDFRALSISAAHHRLVVWRSHHLPLASVGGWGNYGESSSWKRKCRNISQGKS